MAGSAIFISSALQDARGHTGAANLFFSAITQGFRFVVYGPDLRIPFAAATLVTRRSAMRVRGPVIEKFVRVMVEGVKIMFTDKELTYRVLERQLRISDRKPLDAAYDEEIKVMVPRLEFKSEAIQAILDETATVDARAKKSSFRISSTGATWTGWKKAVSLTSSGRQNKQGCEKRRLGRSEPL